jgi:hypothetical protein
MHVLVNEFLAKAVVGIKHFVQLVFLLLLLVVGLEFGVSFCFDFVGF